MFRIRYIQRTENNICLFYQELLVRRHRSNLGKMNDSWGTTSLVFEDIISFEANRKAIYLEMVRWTL